MRVDLALAEGGFVDLSRHVLPRPAHQITIGPTTPLGTPADAGMTHNLSDLCTSRGMQHQMAARAICRYWGGPSPPAKPTADHTPAPELFSQAVQVNSPAAGFVHPEVGPTNDL